MHVYYRSFIWDSTLQVIYLMFTWKFIQYLFWNWMEKKVNIEKEAWNWNKKVKSLLKKENKHGWGKKTRLCEGQWAYKKKPTV